ncbi:hypothetical protein M427DRAFT_69523 [Gonapodya prolifera JEL478]|uniref:Uncharacterized protein n=1 Tax=Gonapodya prolifera (strain JEL478) TaxID=1344416 RepID=A0A139AIE9_GONPJ|nr:hypothetical protein M427DRAFT_69523 [Gonapodya prolifera JEL478]|eukprot:KXS16203.1 hypothetical protein M427DRAFT_69523 [Gonapodya prolifera JEL478]
MFQASLLNPPFTGSADFQKNTLKSLRAPSISLLEAPMSTLFLRETAAGRKLGVTYLGYINNEKPESLHILTAAIAAGAFPRLRRMEFMYSAEELTMDRDAELQFSDDDCDFTMDPCTPIIDALKALLDTCRAVSVTIIGEMEGSAELFELIHLRKDNAASSRRIKSVAYAPKPQIVLERALGGGYVVFDV